MGNAARDLVWQLNKKLGVVGVPEAGTGLINCMGAKVSSPTSNSRAIHEQTRSNKTKLDALADIRIRFAMEPFIEDIRGCYCAP